MDADQLFRAYLDTWPDEWIMWPEGNDGKGKEKMKTLFAVEGDDPLSPHFAFNDILEYVKEECITQKIIYKFSSSEWLQKYFTTVRGRDMAKAHMKRHEPTMAIVMFNTPPFKALMDGFFQWFIDTGVKPCLKG